MPDLISEQRHPLTLKQAILARGIDERRAAASWRRRCRHQSGDRPKVWPGEKTSFLYRTFLNLDSVAVDRAMAAINCNAHATDRTGVCTYVSAWALLNHLKGADHVQP